jgi:hypothetical protein
MKIYSPPIMLYPLFSCHLFLGETINRRVRRRFRAPNVPDMAIGIGKMCTMKFGRLVLFLRQIRQSIQRDFDT